MTHLATFEVPIPYGDEEYNFDYVASCVTFSSHGRVPAGWKYNVTNISIYICSSTLTLKFFQPGLYLNASGAPRVIVYVHNNNQECLTFSAEL